MARGGRFLAALVVAALSVVLAAPSLATEAGETTTTTTATTTTTEAPPPATTTTVPGTTTTTEALPTTTTSIPPDTTTTLPEATTTTTAPVTTTTVAEAPPAATTTTLPESTTTTTVPTTTTSTVPESTTTTAPVTTTAPLEPTTTTTEPPVADTYTDEPACDTTAATCSLEGVPIDEECLTQIDPETGECEQPPPAWFESGMVFPIVGPAGYDQSFEACRDGCTRLHEGVDIFTYGWKGVPVVAAHDGRVTWARVGGELAGCGVILQDRSGWTTHYVHLNTDAPGTDIPSADCFAPEIEVGAWIEAGTLIGWVGDTGNAESTTPHIHFEINDAQGVPVDPWPSLGASTRIDHRWVTPNALTLASTDLHRSEQPIVFVIADSDLPLLASAPDGFDLLDAPLLVASDGNLDDLDGALASLAPESIVLLSDDPDPALLEVLRDSTTLAEVLPIPQKEEEEELVEGSIDTLEAPIAPSLENPSVDGIEDGTLDENPIEEDHRYDAVDPRFLITVVGTTNAQERMLLATLDAEDASENVLLVGGRRVYQDPGASSWSYPDSEFNEVPGVWWPTAEGWIRTDDSHQAPESPIAYANAYGFRDHTLAYLVSLSKAPGMPIWRDIQPTSVLNRSL